MRNNIEIMIQSLERSSIFDVPLKVGLILNTIKSFTSELLNYPEYIIF